MSCDVGKSTEGFENELWRRWSDGKVAEWALLYISISMSSAHSPTFPSLHLPYVTTHYRTLPSLYLRHSSFSNSSVASPASQFILQPFFRFSYVTSSWLNSTGEPPMALKPVYTTYYYTNTVCGDVTYRQCFVSCIRPEIRSLQHGCQKAHWDVQYNERYHLANMINVVSCFYFFSMSLYSLLYSSVSQCIVRGRHVVLEICPYVP